MPLHTRERFGSKADSDWRLISVPPQNDNPHEFEEFQDPAEPREAGEFTRAFGGREDKTKLDSPLSPDGSSSQPGSLTQALGSSLKTAQAASEKPPQASRPIANPPASPAADSFTSAFEGVNAFTRDLGDLREDPFKTEAAKKPRFDAPSSSTPGSGTFTRIFGTGEGVLTPAGPEGDSFPKASPLPKAPMVKEASFSPAPRLSSQERGSFTEAFPAQEPPHPGEATRNGGSFTDQFVSPSQWSAPETTRPTMPPRPYPPATPAPFRAHHEEPLPPGSPATSQGGFTRLISSYDTDASLPSDATRPSMPVPPAPRRPLYDPNPAPPELGAPPNATIAFNPRHSETEFTTPAVKSPYTMIMDGSKLRAATDHLVAGGLSSVTANPPAPPAPIQYPQAPQPPAWPPTPAPPAPHVWGQPPVAAPPMPQPPVVAAPALPQKPVTLGDKLVSFLPVMLALTVINFLGLLAALIILFATRK